MNEIQDLLEKAARAFDAAEALLQRHDADFAASRAYYGCFYIATALLRNEGQRFSSHGQVVSQYGLRFSVTEKLDRRFHQILSRAFRVRQTADYETSVKIPPDEAEDLIRGGREFLEAATRYLADRGAEDDEGAPV